MSELGTIYSLLNVIIDFIFQEMKDQMASPMAMSLSDKKNRQVRTDLSSKIIKLFSDSVDYSRRNISSSLLQGFVCKSDGCKVCFLC